MKIKTKILSVVMLLLAFASSAFAMEAYGLNTVAGSPTVLRSSQGLANSDVVFVVKRPDGSKVEVNAKSSDKGVAVKEFSDYYTSQSGDYAVGIKGESVYKNFKVYAGRVSDINSKVYPSDQVVHSASEKAVIRVSLKDKFNNPVEGHVLKIVSSSSNSNSKYLSSNSKTNSNGELSFELNSDSSGKVTYSVYDATEDLVLSSRANVLYFKSGSASVSGNQLFASVLANAGNASGAVDAFEFRNLPSKVRVGDSVSFGVAALDAADQSVVNYDGTVRFAVSGGNSSYVTLPQDYNFKLEDQGEHVFSLAFSFQKAGTYDLEVRDLENPAVSGTISVIVEDSLNGVSGSQSSTSGVSINNPASGGVYSNNVQVISGNAPAGSNLRIFDNNIKIGEIVVDSSGTFSFTSGLLQDGAHKIYVATVNEVGTIISTSSTVDFNIDTNPAELGQVVITPSGSVDPGEIVLVKLIVQDDLDKVELTLNGNLYDLTKTPEGTYEVSVPAPIDFGDYKLKFNLVDQLGNESSFDDAATLKVGKITSSSNNTGDTLAKVTGLTVSASNSKVILNWVEPSVGADSIVNYRVFYGLSPNQLINAVDTFTNATTWYIPGLTNGQNYYFAVAAIDGNGAMSNGFDKVVTAVPSSALADVVSPNVLNGVDGSEALDDMETDVSETGPEILWLVLFAALGGLFYSETTKRRLRLKGSVSKDC